ncbi:MAG: cytochrome c family protein [Rhodoferax sp.]|uniref:c-type cytochrome n=1 Tax=Rhodoferax sp. TaxID=50421 RepID=UPI0026350F02|nr:cytochrome c family protein [Rhodoferax sp.]MDD5334623.1 cytochrome c family protein [Rhodoferax sp.]
MKLRRRAALLAACALWAAAGAGLAASADALRGEQLYGRCLACHALATDRVGPRHCGLLGRRAGSVAGFDYSAAMKKSGLVWDEKTLDRFLRKPLDLVPGSSMTYDGVPLASERRDLIAYLKAVANTAACRAGR